MGSPHDGHRSKENCNPRKTGHHPPGTRRTADTSPPDEYTPARHIELCHSPRSPIRQPTGLLPARDKVIGTRLRTRPGAPPATRNRHRHDPLGRLLSGNAKSPGYGRPPGAAEHWCRHVAHLLCGQGFLRAPTETPQVRLPAAIPTETPRTKRHTAVRLLYLLKVRYTVTDQCLRALAGHLALFQVSAFRLIELLKSGRSTVRSASSR